MKLNDNILNELFNISINYVTNNLDKYNYSDDIKHLLYIIIPAFITKYGLENKNKVLKVFEEVPILIKNNDERILQAYYLSIPLCINESVIVSKHIVINMYEDKDLLELIDNIVHEYNHALNSIENNIKTDDKYIYLRTGLTYIKYNKEDYKDGGKDDTYILEEIINTKQTEEIINIINSFNKYNINNTIISNSLYNIDKFINNEYSSQAYLLQSTLCKNLMDNHTLISVFSNLRFHGNIDEVSYFFDNITGIDNSYNELIKILNDTVKLEEEYDKTKLFRNNKLKKLKILHNRAQEIIDTFNRNYHFK